MCDVADNRSMVWPIALIAPTDSRSQAAVLTSLDLFLPLSRSLPGESLLDLLRHHREARRHPRRCAAPSCIHSRAVPTAYEVMIFTERHRSGRRLRQLVDPLIGCAALLDRLGCNSVGLLNAAADVRQSSWTNSSEAMAAERIMLGRGLGCAQRIGPSSSAVERASA